MRNSVCRDYFFVQWKRKNWTYSMMRNYERLCSFFYNMIFSTCFRYNWQETMQSNTYLRIHEVGVSFLKQLGKKVNLQNGKNLKSRLPGTGCNNNYSYVVGAIRSLFMYSFTTYQCIFQWMSLGVKHEFRAWMMTDNLCSVTQSLFLSFLCTLTQSLRL